MKHIAVASYCLLTLLAAPYKLAAGDAPSISGLYEVCIGVRDPLSQIRYWQRFGFSVDRTGTLTAEAAERLYGVRSELTGVRLRNQTSDHGYVRLMVWRSPVNEGLGLSHMKVKGNRWSSLLTADLMDVWNHTEAAAAAGRPIYYLPPQRNPIGAAGGEPFVDPLLHVRDFVLVQPLTRQVLFQRYGYVRPLYGRINESAHFRTSQVTHVGIVMQGARELLDFYEQVLGLLRTQDNSESTYENLVARNLFELQPGERYFLSAFDDPRSSTDFEKMRSGRLIAFRFPHDVTLEDELDRSRPGALGVSLYTYRVRGIGEHRKRVREGGATGVTEISPNEFGEPSFSFMAPDGYFWTLVE